MGFVNVVYTQAYTLKNVSYPQVYPQINVTDNISR